MSVTLLLILVNDCGIVSLRRTLRHTCGATILNARRILTAAHCICTDDGQPQDASVFTIQYGSVRISATTERSIQVSRIHCHDFNLEDITNDVAVLENQGPIPTVLQKLDVLVYTDQVCSRFDPRQHVCFGATVGGACNGDSGTSLVVADEQVGIASFITNTCGIATERYPNVYAKVTAFLDFIDEHSRL
ncbi:hypothetical protein NQ314_007989 [Rhamnusium bicolor]|uniref:Peptidase S1 domain-containing protein n=1 Tax=Rhamnusium bicolor TaxID=1586634 RepID=A0AAV8YHZ8_9CUCU|nr:hypothetical protein NQ314_007989 [Rhamnusium bicolor]